MSEPVGTGFSKDLHSAINVARPFLGTGARRSEPGHRSVISGHGAQTQLAHHLYTHWFTRFRQTPEAPLGWNDCPSLVARLRAAHAASGRFESGWTVAAIRGRGVLVVERRGERVEVKPPDYANLARPAVPARPGDPVAITARRDYVDLENGWWMSEGCTGPAPAAPVIRLYWNCPADTVTTLVTGLTDIFERARVPYTLKCPDKASLFGRADAVVVYLGPVSFVNLKHALRDLHRRVEQSLFDRVPPFTLCLGRGVAAAEDPGNGQSFGQSRCTAVANALIDADRAGITAEGGLARAIVAGLEAYGISSERPYLASASPPDRVTAWD